MIIHEIFNWLSFLIWPVIVLYFIINAWRLIQGNFSKKHAGDLVYKDDYYNPEIIAAMMMGVLLIFAIVIYIMFNEKKTLFDFIPFLLFLLLIGITALKGLTGIEIWENGIFSKEGFIKWEDIDYYQCVCRNKFNILKIKIKNRNLNLPINDDKKDHINDLIKSKIPLKD